MTPGDVAAIVPHELGPAPIQHAYNEFTFLWRFLPSLFIGANRDRLEIDLPWHRWRTVGPPAAPCSRSNHLRCPTEPATGVPVVRLRGGSRVPDMTEPADASAASDPTPLTPEEKAERSSSFGNAASLYERFRPGPPVESVEWLLTDRPSTVVDLGAGTGALSRLLLDRVPAVIAVEPDDRMRGVLEQNLPAVTAVPGRGEFMPLSDNSADAVLASSSWHWVDVVPALREVARVLVPGGTLGAVWSGPDPEGPFLMQAQALLGAGTSPDADGRAVPSGRSDIAEMVFDAQRFETVLAIPDGEPFTEPVQHVHRWDIALNADELIGLLGTFSRIIIMPEEQRTALLAEVRRLLRKGLGVEGAVTVDVTYRSEAWRTRLLD